MRKLFAVAGSIAVGLMLAFSAHAQTYPTRSINLIVPYPPGGGVDAMARIVAEKLSHALGQQVVVDNRGGGGGLIGTRAVQRRRPTATRSSSATPARSRSIPVFMPIRVSIRARISRRSA